MPSEELPSDTVLANEMQGDTYRGFLERLCVFLLQVLPSNFSPPLKADVMPGGAAAALQPQGKKHQK